MKSNDFTPAQATAMWCPMVRASNGTDSPANCGNSKDYRKATFARCIADQCAMWRWSDKRLGEKDLTHGYCGLAGRPEFSA